MLVWHLVLFSLFGLEKTNKFLHWCWTVVAPLNLETQHISEIFDWVNVWALDRSIHPINPFVTIPVHDLAQWSSTKPRKTSQTKIPHPPHFVDTIRCAWRLAPDTLDPYPVIGTIECETGFMNPENPFPWIYCPLSM